MKNWWKTFFKPITGEIMFKTRSIQQSQKEVDQILSQIKVRRKVKLLDLCCGEGRHSLLFSKKGHDVTGLDFSENFLKVARDKAKAARQKISFIKADMREVSSHVDKNSFDAVVSLFNSFGYFDLRKDDFKVLKEVHKVLKPGGFFVINTINGNGAKIKLKAPVSCGYEPLKNVFVIDRAFLDFKKMRTHAHWTIVDARKAKTPVFRGSFQQNVYTHHEMKQLLKKAGFRVVKTWGPLQGGAFGEATSWHQTVLAQKLPSGKTL
jgi:ubiquinone/menaquinone biosynthesis C-methylase UbiE